MDRDDIIRMVREAHLDVYGLGKDREKFVSVVERFANLVASEEREACAEVAEQIEREIFDAVGDPRVSEFKSKIAAAIRARGPHD